MRFPDFYIVGAMKGGTTSLADYLKLHPGVHMPRKEPKFFNDEETWGNGVDWYASLYAGARPDQKIGDGSTTYSIWPYYDHVVERMADLVPKAQLIYVVRDPIDRIRSHYVHNWAFGDERRSVSDAIVPGSAYVLGSSYTTQLDHFLTRFPDEQLLVITSDALKHDRLATVEKVMGYLGLEGDWDSSGLADESHVSDVKTAAVRPGFRRLWKLGPYRALAKRTPPSVKKLAHRVTRTEFQPNEVRLPDALVADLREQLTPEVAGLRRWLGPEFDGWGLLDSSEG